MNNTLIVLSADHYPYAMTDEELVRFCEAKGVRLRALSSYYHLPIPQEDQRCLVINYAGVNQQELENLLDAWADT